MHQGKQQNDGLLLSRVEDAFDAAKKRAVCFLDFFDPREQAAAARAAAAHKEAAFLFYGGCEGAERRMLGVFADPAEALPARFPIQAVRIGWRQASLTHRDVLGALLALGIRREKVGDLLMEASACTALLEQTVARYVLANLVRAGRAAVSVEPCDAVGLRREQRFEGIGDTVASARLDCVVGALLHLSRTQAQQLVASGAVELDFAPAANPARAVAGGAVLSVRGHGRFAVDELGPETRKGRLRLSARRYL